MTLDEIKALDKDFLIPSDIASYLGVCQYNINLQVKSDKEKGINSFPFPTILIGTRVKIPRIAFIRAMTEPVQNVTINNYYWGIPETNET